MTEWGKGGKGLGKGGAKHHWKVLRDNILLSADWLDFVVSSISLDSSMRRPKVSSRFSLRKAWCSHLHWACQKEDCPPPTMEAVLSMLWGNKAEPPTDLVVKQSQYWTHQSNSNCPLRDKKCKFWHLAQAYYEWPLHLTWFWSFKIFNSKRFWHPTIKYENQLYYNLAR